MSDQPSICIPKVSKNISKKNIIKIFNNLQFGNIKNVDIVNYHNSRNNNYSRVFIHFNKWYTDIPIIKTYHDKLVNGENLSIVYNEPWFWKLFLYQPTVS